MKYLLAPIVAWTICQIAKVTLTSVRQRRLNLRVLAETGGMPSSHSAGPLSAISAVRGKYAAPKSRSSPMASHVSHIFTKLGVTSRSAATAFAYDRHLV